MDLGARPETFALDYNLKFLLSLPEWFGIINALALA
jgi:hypothetical protein